MLVVLLIVFPGRWLQSIYMTYYILYEVYFFGIFLLQSNSIEPGILFLFFVSLQLKHKPSRFQFQTGIALIK